MFRSSKNRDRLAFAIMPTLRPILFTVFISAAFAQTPNLLKHPLTKKEQLAKFHAETRTGAPAEQRMASYKARAAMDAASPYQNIKWRSVGPEYQGGRVVSIAAPASNPRQVYVAYATGGLWRTEDEGYTYTPLFDHESAYGIGDVAVSKDGKTIWIGSGEANSSRTSYSGTGVFKSTDSGATWKWMGLPESHHIGKILIDPDNENTVYVAALGHLYTANNERGVYRTTDGGATWQQVLKVDANTGAIDLALSGNKLFAFMWDRRRVAWDFAESGAGSGLYVSPDKGTTWSKVQGLPGGENLGRGGLSISPANPNRVFLTLDNQSVDEADEFEDAEDGILTPTRLAKLSNAKAGALPKTVLATFFDKYLPAENIDDWQKDLASGKKSVKDLIAMAAKKRPQAFEAKKVFGEVYRSDDGGSTWAKAHAGGIGPDYGYYFNKVFASPYDANCVMLASLGLSESNDGGQSWKPVAANAHSDFHAVYFDPTNPNRIIVGNDGGVYFSLDGGKNFRSGNTIPVGQPTTLALDNQSPYHIYTGLQDNGTMEGPSNYVPGENDPNDWKVVGFGDGSAVAVDAKGEVLYVAYQWGGHSAANRKTGEQWQAAPRSKEGMELRFNWVSPIFVSSFHPDVVYVGSQHLHRSFDKGKHYEAISPDITKAKPFGNVNFGTLKDISESPLQFGLILVGADDGTVAYTPDGGYEWKKIPTPAPNKWVSRVIASKYDKSTFYVAQNGYRDDDFAPYLWKSTDSGKTWKSIAGNLPQEPINVVREDPNDSNTLYVGTDMGVYASVNGGQAWASLNSNLPHVAVHDLAVQAKAKELVAATHGRSIWIIKLDDLYQLDNDVMAKDLYLFKPEEMSRKGWGVGKREVYEEDTEDHKLTLKVYSKSGGPTSVTLTDTQGKIALSNTMSLTPGINYVQLDLKLSKGKVIPAHVATDPKNPVADNLAPYRPKFLPSGKYKLVVASGTKSVESDWTLAEK